MQHVLARKNACAPFSDNRKIALVLFGGVMSGVTSGGALIALEDLGCADAFDSIYCLSAGFPNASYLLSHETRKGESIYYEDLIDRQFLHWLRFWKVADIDKVVTAIRTTKAISVNRVLASKTKLFIALRNMTDHRNEFHELHDYSEKEYFSLLRAAISIPFLHPGKTIIRGKKYMDCYGGGTMIMNEISKGEYSDVLVLLNYSTQLPMTMQSTPALLLLRPNGSKSSDRFITQKGKLQQMGISMGTQLMREAGEKTTLVL